MPPAILFVHNNFPGQFGFLCQALRARGTRVAAIGQATAPGLPDVPMVRWKHGRGTSPGIFPPATRAEADLIRGHAAAHAALALKDKGFEPGLIIGHPGWGETLFLGEVFPRARRIEYAEFFYRSEGGDVGFDPEFPPLDMEKRFRLHAKNATMALALAEADRIVAPSAFQASMLPPRLREATRIIHEGVDTEAIRPDPDASFRLPDGRVLDRSRPVVTFINRRFGPLRGCHIFFRALPALLDAVPAAEIILIGANEVGNYDPPPPAGRTWRDVYLDEIRGRVDLSRLHFTGRLPYPDMLKAIAASSAHVYLTYPFVVSWSLFEAMASGAVVIGSDTAPVREVVSHGENGLLVDFFAVDGLAAAMIDACRRPAEHQALREGARRAVVERFDRQSQCLPAWLGLVDEVLELGPRGAC
ncbi:glycosyltransferase [Methylomagnum sp.]